MPSGTSSIRLALASKATYLRQYFTLPSGITNYLRSTRLPSFIHHLRLSLLPCNPAASNFPTSQEGSEQPLTPKTSSHPPSPTYSDHVWVPCFHARACPSPTKHIVLFLLLPLHHSFHQCLIFHISAFFAFFLYYETIFLRWFTLIAIMYGHEISSYWLLLILFLICCCLMLSHHALPDY